jgi:peptide/nickel transport system ATP-binding protein
MLAPPGEDGRRVVGCLRGGVVTVLEARALRKSWQASAGILGRQRVLAVDGVDVDVREGEVVGIAGPSGAGKSTLALMLAGLLEPDAGTIALEGEDLIGASGAELKAMRRRLQLLFQDPYEALSPRFTVAEAVGEPLEAQGVIEAAGRAEVVADALAAVRLPTNQAFLGRRAHQLSGGQLQRVALARALVLDPKLLVADEPVSMLDPSEQAKMLQLLKTLQVERGMAMVLISHDLAVLLRVADRVAVLHHGKVVEQASGTSLLLSARQDVSRALLTASGWPLAHGLEDGNQAHFSRQAREGVS